MSDDDRWTDDHARDCCPSARPARVPGALPTAPPAPASVPPGFAVRKVVDSRAPMLAGTLADDALWRRPVVGRCRRRRPTATDLSRALDRIPALLAEMRDPPDARCRTATRRR